MKITGQLFPRKGVQEGTSLLSNRNGLDGKECTNKEAVVAEKET